MSKSKGWTLQSSLLMLWMDENSSQQSNKIADDEKLTITLLFNNQMAQIAPTRGIEGGTLNR